MINHNKDYQKKSRIRRCSRRTSKLKKKVKK